ncbi:MAG: hypothetical protein ACI9FN_000517 [Saprospiraceae bacterium]|jgi:hypothetical protein
MKYTFLSTLLILFFAINLVAQESSVPDNYKLVYTQDFATPQATSDFEMTDRRAWRIAKEGENDVLQLFGKSDYKARVRSPFNIALLKEPIVGDFVMEVKLAQSGKEYGHRDLCLFFGVNSPTDYYYVHIASITDDHANNIFIVNDEPRTKISSKTTSGTDWGPTNSWHKARVERNVTEGTIKIYFDDMSTPIMEATDTHFDKGRIGFGSFDDTGQFDEIKIWAPAVIEPQTTFFKNGN